MVYNQLRSFRAPLICVLGFLVFLLIFWLVELPQNNGGLQKNSPLPPPMHQKAIVHHGSLLSLEAEQDLSPNPARSQEDQDLESLLRGNEDEGWAQGPKCAPYPRFDDIKFPNPSFQLTRHGNLSYYLYGAYYDRRPRMPEVMVLVMVTTSEGPYPETHLQTWFDGDTVPETLSLHETKVAWYSDWGTRPGLVYPTLLTFQLKSPRIPQLVSLVFGHPCAVPQNALKVIQPPAEEPPNPYRPLRTGICVKYLHFPDVDMSERLVEWLELMRLLGAGRVTAYDIGELMPNTSRTLAHYSRSGDGLLDLRKFEFPLETKEHKRFQHIISEVLLYNDCFYRSLYDFDFVAMMDVDEVIMPLGKYLSWSDLLRELQIRDVNCTARSSYCFRNVYFPKELPEDSSIPSSFYMLRHVVRVAEHLNPALAIKCFHSTGHASVLHNHFALQWMDACGPQDVSPDLGQLQHYRHVDNVKTLEEPAPKRDDNIRRFQQQLIHNSMAVHRQLGWGAAY
ncbi:uncharacterized protein LOC119556457 [Drosophila subpulchrella]|uniref:uncharacterized protein LOC119556457 n=1 Tax=Drosophila subpulchrella TaxID=1486046 RepID=UPI0018A172DD|nr:uncharacterized protein LOC119556457 [Drosophila subpulchrella]